LQIQHIIMHFAMLSLRGLVMTAVCCSSSMVLEAVILVILGLE